METPARTQTGLVADDGLEKLDFVDGVHGRKDDDNRDKNVFTRHERPPWKVKAKKGDGPAQDRPAIAMLFKE